MLDPENGKIYQAKMRLGCVAYRDKDSSIA